MKTLALALLCSCITRTAPVAPQPEPSYHVALDLVTASKAGAQAKCTAKVQSPLFDSALCDFPTGAQLYCWHAQPGGFACYQLYVPPPPEQPKPPVVEAPKAEAPKKK